VDRFLLKIEIGYPSTADERRMLETYDHPVPTVPRVLDPAGILALRTGAAALHVSGEVKDYIVSLVSATRNHPRVRLGASPRAALGLMRAAKAMAFWTGRDFVLPDDVRALAGAVLGHRLIVTPEAELDGFTGRDAVDDTVRGVAFRGPGTR
jgi:MoxR-like ATPase